MKCEFSMIILYITSEPNPVADPDGGSGGFA